MEIMVAVGLVVAGIVGLVSGGEFLVRGSAKLAAAIGISPLVVGLTVVAFATSAPELAVVVQSSIVDKTDLAIGNAVGSNIFNVLFVLGLSALITPLVVQARVVRLDVPLMVAASFLLLVLSWDGYLGRIDGLVMFLLLISYIVWTVIASRKAEALIRREFAKEFSADENPRIALQIVWVVAGLILLIFGAQWVVAGCVTIAESLGVSELVIGLTVIAIGTSLPEVVASIVASYRGERDIAVGNIVGSNLFNILGVLGLGSAVAPGGIPVSAAAIQFDMPVMVAVAVACLPIFYVGNKIERWEGGLLFGYYIGYTTYLILEASGKGNGWLVQYVMMGFVIPLTAITFLVVGYRYWKRSRQDRSETVSDS